MEDDFFDLFELLMYGPKEILGLLEDDCDGTGD
jgi:hypothetical protein